MLKVTACLFVLGLGLTTLLLAVWVQHFSLTTTAWDVLLSFALVTGIATACAGVAMLVLAVFALFARPLRGGLSTDFQRGCAIFENVHSDGL